MPYALVLLRSQDVAEALRRLPPNIVVERNCRLRRAIDLSMKKETLPYDLQAKQTPDEHYLAVRLPTACMSHTLVLCSCEILCTEMDRQLHHSLLAHCMHVRAACVTN